MCHLIRGNSTEFCLLLSVYCYCKWNYIWTSFINKLKIKINELNLIPSNAWNVVDQMYVKRERERETCTQHDGCE